MKKYLKNFKLRTIIVSGMMFFGLFPIIFWISLNLSNILERFERAIETENRLQLIKLTSDMEDIIQRRKEMVRIVSNIPGIIDLVNNFQNPQTVFTINQKKSRISGMIRQWLENINDITAITVWDKDLQAVYCIYRDDDKLESRAFNPEEYLEYETIINEAFSNYGDHFISEISYKVEEKEGYHTHSSVLRLANSIRNNKGKNIGVVVIDINFNTFSTDFKDVLFISGKGKYIHKHKSENQHNHLSEDVFRDFPKLEDHIKKDQSSTLIKDINGHIYSLIPLVQEKHYQHTIWAAKGTDQSELEIWLSELKQRFIILFIFIFIILFVIGRKVSKNIDKMNNTILTNLQEVLTNKKQVQFNWQGTKELEVLKTELNQLVSKYIDSCNLSAQAEKQFRELSLRQKMILDSAAEGIIEVNNEYEIQFANQAFTKMIGADLKDIIGKTMDVLIGKKNGGDSPDECSFCQEIKKDEQFQKEDIFYNNQNEAIDVIYIGSQMKNKNGEKVGTVVCIQDIREIKKLEYDLIQSTKLQGVGQLAGGIAHDFNNILTAINGFSEIALMQLKETHPAWESVKNAISSGERATSLVRQLLAFSRKQVYSPKIINPNELIFNLSKMLSRLIGEDISFRMDLSENVNNIKADPGQIEQILTNLVVNARDAVMEVDKPEKQIIIKTENTRLDEDELYTSGNLVDGEYIIFKVSDNGAGMEQDIIENIFDPFFTTKEQGRGTGLGLSTIYGIIKQNSGHVNVFSKIGEGSEFNVYWPAVKEEAESLEIGSSENMLDGGRESILIVEDNMNVLDFAEKALSRLGYTISIANNGNDALVLIRDKNKKIDLLLTDVVMPEMNGNELAEKAMEIRPELLILYSSGYTENHIAVSGVLNEGINFIQKPYSIKFLAKKIREIFIAAKLSE